MKLVIVESPAKAKTISRFLGKEYRVEASYGHIRDLPSSASEIPESCKSKPWARLGVDIENDFAPVYVVQADSKKQIAELKKLMKDATEVVLATDEDREGEAISWHLLEILKPKVPVSRIVFHEITEEAIREAVSHPRKVNDELVRAQESRRILDRLFGYELSPVVWKNISVGAVAKGCYILTEAKLASSCVNPMVEKVLQVFGDVKQLLKEDDGGVCKKVCTGLLEELFANKLGAAVNATVVSDDKFKALVGDSKSRLFKILQPAVRKSNAIGDLTGRILEVAQDVCLHNTPPRR